MGGIKHTYTLDGAKILREQWVEGEDIKREITPLYDNEDNVCGILHCDIPYYFLKNLQGDVIAITNQRGETVVRYTYDAWGSCTITYDATATPADEDAVAINIATVNPFRYRSYYFDTETGLYYLQSRYYDPALGRFVNGDNPKYTVFAAKILGANTFAYCANNTVNCSDEKGTDAIWLQATKSVLGMGHTGLLFQYGGMWYYWYWGFHTTLGTIEYIGALMFHMLFSPPLYGTDRGINIISGTIGTSVRATVGLQKFTPKVQILPRNVETSVLPGIKTLYPSGFNKWIYMRGSFAGLYSYFAGLKRNPIYNLLSKNCMQTTVDGLRKGKFNYNHQKKMALLANARKMIIPNVAYKYLAGKL